MKIAKPLLYLLFITAAHSAYAQQAHVNLDWNPQKNGENLTPFMANIISPEVRDDRTVTFRLKAPQAREVALAPGPLLLALGKGNAPIPFAKGGDGEFAGGRSVKPIFWDFQATNRHNQV